MHFDKKSSDFNEEHYITCILEENGVEVTPSESFTEVTEVGAKSNSIDADGPFASQGQLHSCDECNYSSSYKGNVVSFDFQIGSNCQMFNLNY